MKRILLITAIVVAAILYFRRKPMPRVPGVDYSIDESLIGCFLEPLPTMSGDARWYGNEYD